MSRNNKAQTMLEYIILVGLVAVVLYAMSPYIKRSLQAIVKVTADQIGNQVNSEQNYSETGGYLVETYQRADHRSETTRRDRLYVTQYDFDDMSDSFSNVVTNLGFSEGN